MTVRFIKYFICFFCLFSFSCKKVYKKVFLTPAYEKSGNLKGIDVSNFQGEIDWAKVKEAGIDFAFARATTSVTYKDPTFARNWEQMKNNKILRGAYHFYYANQDPIKQAENYLEAVSLNYNDLPPSVSIDFPSLAGYDSKNALDKKIANEEKEFAKALTENQIVILETNFRLFLEKIQKETYRKPLIYTSVEFWDEYFSSESDFSTYPLWIEDYNHNKPVLPMNWNKWRFWQYSETEALSGIQGDVAADVFRGGEITLALFLFWNNEKLWATIVFGILGFGFFSYLLYLYKRELP